MGLLDGKIGLITGGSVESDGTCEGFAREGVGYYIQLQPSDDLAREVVEKIQSMGRKAVSYWFRSRTARRSTRWSARSITSSAGSIFWST
ncbi:MAG: hypothetical protein IPO77_02325 [Acidobacteria bacterium]|nr:hypothetical protein [Acidobacteriota bacterium]